MDFSNDATRHTPSNSAAGSPDDAEADLNSSAAVKDASNLTEVRSLPHEKNRQSSSGSRTIKLVGNSEEQLPDQDDRQPSNNDHVQSNEPADSKDVTTSDSSSTITDSSVSVDDPSQIHASEESSSQSIASDASSQDSISETLEPFLVVDSRSAEPAHLLMRSGNATVVSRRCLTKETANEDAAVVVPIGERGVVLAVADGVGGLPQGEAAARLTLQTLVEYVAKANDPDRIRIAIVDAIEKANRRVLALGGGAGTTLAVAQIIDHRIRTYHVGDSEIFVVGGRGAVKLQTLSHGPVAYGVHCGLIDPAEALVHEYRNVISNVVGAHDMRIELGPQLKLAQRDLVLVCSDGITDNLYPEELVRSICGKAPDVAASVLMEEMDLRREQKGELEFKDDDSTFVLYRRSKVSNEK